MGKDRTVRSLAELGDAWGNEGGTERIERRDRAPRDDEPKQRRERDTRRESRRESFPTLKTDDTTTETEDRSRQSGTTRREPYVKQNTDRTERTPTPFGEARRLAREITDPKQDMSALDAALAKLDEPSLRSLSNVLITEVLENQCPVSGAYHVAQKARNMGRMVNAITVRRTGLDLVELTKFGIAEAVVNQTERGERSYIAYHLNRETLKAAEDKLRESAKADKAAGNEAEANRKFAAAKVFEDARRESDKRFIIGQKKRELRDNAARQAAENRADATGTSSDAPAAEAPEATTTAETLVEANAETLVEASEAAPAAEDTSASAETLVEAASDAVATPVEASAAKTPKPKRNSKRAVAGA